MCSVRHINRFAKPAIDRLITNRRIMRNHWQQALSLYVLWRLCLKILQKRRHQINILCQTADPFARICRTGQMNEQRNMNQLLVGRHEIFRRKSVFPQHMAVIRRHHNEGFIIYPRILKLLNKRSKPVIHHGQRCRILIPQMFHCLRSLLIKRLV